MTLTAGEIARMIDGRVHGDDSVTVTSARPVHQARECDVTYAADEVNLRALSQCSAAVAIIHTDSLSGLNQSDIDPVLITVDREVEPAFLELAASLCPRRDVRGAGVSERASVAATAQIGEGTVVHDHVWIGENVQIGKNCTLYPGVHIAAGCCIGDEVALHPNVVLYDDVIVGNNVTIHAGAVIGCEGFGYRTVAGRHERIMHYGIVRICDHTEIGAGTTVDRAKVGETVIGEGTKIDNQVMVAHNCELGRHNLLVSQVGFAGSVTTGDYVVCAGQAGIADHVHLGDGCVIGAKSGVHRDMPGGQTYLGSPAAPVEETRRQLMALRRLPEMRKSLRQLEQQVAALTSLLNDKSSTSPGTEDQSEAA